VTTAADRRRRPGYTRGVPTLSTAEARRPQVIAGAIRAFARTGYLGTTVADVGREAGISTAYVAKLFPTKEGLFVAALDRCFDLVAETLEAGADAAPDSTPAAVLHAMGGAYADLIAERDYLLLQVHAQSATAVPEIAAAVRRGLARIVSLASSRSGAADADVQSFVAFGQLCHLIVTAGVSDADAAREQWARILTDGIRHPER
jgi:AcrR family transcriptional regulator